MELSRCTRFAVPILTGGLILMTLTACQVHREHQAPILYTEGASALLGEGLAPAGSVPDSSAIRILSGFNRGAIELSSLEPMTLADCVAEAGGLCWWADPSRVLVIRPRESGSVAFRLHLHHIEALPCRCFLIRPGDQLIVSAYPLIEWARALQTSLLSQAVP